MAFLDLAKKRASIRGYTNDPVTDAELSAILEAGRLAPTACNRQPIAVIVIRNQENRSKLAEVYGREWFVAAPVIIAVCLDTEAQWIRADGKEYGEIDAAIVLDHMTLAAAELGLGTCWVGNFNRGKAVELLGLPDSFEPVAFTPLGRPAAAPNWKKRKEAGEIVHWEFYGGKQ